MPNFYGLLYGIILIDYALEIQERDTLKQGWNTKNPAKYNLQNTIEQVMNRNNPIQSSADGYNL